MIDYGHAEQKNLRGTLLEVTFFSAFSDFSENQKNVNVFFLSGPELNKKIFRYFTGFPEFFFFLNRTFFKKKSAFQKKKII